MMMPLIICPMSKDDIADARRIERQSFSQTWKHKDFELAFDNGHSAIAAYIPGPCLENVLVAYAFCRRKYPRFKIVNFAVDPAHRRSGIGAAMIRRIANEALRDQCDEIIVTVREKNLVALQFFRAMGLEAGMILRNEYAETPEDAYVMSALPERILEMIEQR